MANMATDSWFPHRFSALSDRLTMRNGVLLMGVAAAAALVYAWSSTAEPEPGAAHQSLVSKLVVMYAINVFVTFTLSNVGMSRLWISRRKTRPGLDHATSGSTSSPRSCASMILAVTVFEKFSEGAWVTIVVTLGAHRALLRDQAPLRRSSSARSGGSTTSCPAPRT